MELDKKYDRVMFSAAAISKIIQELETIIKDHSKIELSELMVERNNATWKFDDLEEFISELGEENVFRAEIIIKCPNIRLHIYNFHPDHYGVSTTVSISSDSRNNIKQLFNKIDEFIHTCTLPMPSTSTVKKFKIFIGHGGSEQWRKLKDHLQDQHNLDVIAYETGSRSGHSIRDIITGMLNCSSMAFLIMTGEDLMDDKTVRSRQNVIHEIGLFQGKLGYEKAIVLKEEYGRIFQYCRGATN